MKILLNRNNSDNKTKQVCESMYEFFSGVKDSQKLVMKGWLQSVLYLGVKYKRRQTNVSYILPGVYRNATYSPIPFEYANLVISSLQQYMDSVGAPKHGLIGRVSNAVVNHREKHEDIRSRLHTFFRVSRDKQRPIQ